MFSQVEQAFSFNLEQYFSKLTLRPIIHGPDAPAMPPDKMRGTLIPLSLNPAGYRKLREMHRFDLSKKIIKYFSKLETVEMDAFRTLRAVLEHDNNCEGDNGLNPYIIFNASSLNNLLCQLLSHIHDVLESLDGTMHDWSFETLCFPHNDRAGPHLINPILYCLPRPSAFKPSSVKLVILAVCPWEFTPQDFVEFSTMGRFDDIISMEWQSRKWVNADKMWAHLYDVCLYNECPLFVVTSYEQWTFGRFSKHYTNAWFSPTLSFDNKPLSIVEMLIFWIHASFEKEDTFTPPNIYNERQLTDVQLETEVRTHAQRYMSNFFSGTEPKLNTKHRRMDSSEDDMPTAKRRRANSSGDDKPPASQPVISCRRRPSSDWKKLRKLQRKRHANGRLSLGSARSTVSIAPSVAPSSSEPLPEAMIPQKRNDWCERWRNMLAVDEHNTDTQQSNEPPLQAYDLTITDEISNFVQVKGRTYPSCCSFSPTLSACSLGEEQLEKWKLTRVEDFSNYTIYQWHENRLGCWAEA